MATPFGAGSFSSSPWGVGSSRSPYTGGPVESGRLRELLASNLLAPDEFIALPDNIKGVYGNYRMYASAWQARRRGKRANTGAYQAALAGEDIIPSPSGGRTSRTSGGRVSSRRTKDEDSARPRVRIGLSGERERIPEAAIGRDISGKWKFRIPEEETAYRQSEAMRRYEEAAFKPRLREKAIAERARMIGTEVSLKVAERELETERRAADKDINQTIDRLLKSKDLKEVAEGRRLKKDVDRFKRDEQKREFTRKRDEAKYNRRVDLLKRRGVQRSAEIDQIFSNSLERMSQRKEQAMEIYKLRRDDIRGLAEYRSDEKWVNTDTKYKMDLLKIAIRTGVRAGEEKIKQGMRIDDADMVTSGQDMIVKVESEGNAEFNKIMAEHKERLGALKGGKAEEPLKAGDIKDGYKFKGGNPADQNNWEKVQ